MYKSRKKFLTISLLNTKVTLLHVQSVETTLFNCTFIIFLGCLNKININKFIAIVSEVGRTTLLDITLRTITNLRPIEMSQAT